MFVRKLIAAAVLSPVLGLGLMACSGPAAAEPTAPTAEGLAAQLNGAGPIQRAYGYRMLEMSARIGQCNRAHPADPTACAPWWMQADQLAGEMRDGIGAQPDSDRYLVLAERLRQYQITAGKYRSWGCELGPRDLSNDCERLTSDLVGHWSNAGIDLETIEPSA